MKSLLKQIKQRRLKLGFKQADMLLRVGISRQQYQRIESKGNPRLDTLELIAQGLNCEVMLIPKEKYDAVQALLDLDSTEPKITNEMPENTKKNLIDDPWQDIWGDN